MVFLLALLNTILGWRAAPALDEGEVAGNAHPLLDTNIRLEAIPPQDVNVVGISPMQDRQFSIALSRHSLSMHKL